MKIDQVIENAFQNKLPFVLVTPTHLPTTIKPNRFWRSGYHFAFLDQGIGVSAQTGSGLYCEGYNINIYEGVKEDFFDDCRDCEIALICEDGSLFQGEVWGYVPKEILVELLSGLHKGLSIEDAFEFLNDFENKRCYRD